MASLIRRTNGSLVDERSRRRASGLPRFAASQLVNLIESADFPCVGAKSAFAKDAFLIGVYDRLNTEGDAHNVYNDVGAFLDKVADGGAFQGELSTFVALYTGMDVLSENMYHTKLWEHLSRLFEMEPDSRYVPDTISEDVRSEHFAFCIHGTPFFIVGLHPAASRYARRFAYPAIVFNRHSQFADLKNLGRFEKMQTTIRRRDQHIQNNINPNLADFGEESEACQYSGKPGVTPNECPFSNKETNNA